MGASVLALSSATMLAVIVAIFYYSIYGLDLIDLFFQFGEASSLSRDKAFAR